jgi:hypothetical protein
MINIPFLLRIVLQIIQVLLNSNLFGDDDRQTLSGIVENVKRIKRQ